MLVIHLLQKIRLRKRTDVSRLEEQCYLQERKIFFSIHIEYLEQTKHAVSF